jgi:hypothetical protein
MREIECGAKQESEQFKPHSAILFEDKLIVTGQSASKGEIQEFDLNGTHVRTIYKPEERFVLAGMCVTDDNNIAVCWNGKEKQSFNSGIKLFNKEGDLVREFYAPDKNEQPLYVAYGNDKYFVSYYSANCIRVFDSDGVFLYKFGEQGKRDGQFDKVGGLALFGPDLILVCDHCNNRVQLLTHEGQYITSFGSGYMNRPADVVVTSDGRVLVINLGSKQVQIYR